MYYESYLTLKKILSKRIVCSDTVLYFKIEETRKNIKYLIEENYLKYSYFNAYLYISKTVIYINNNNGGNLIVKWMHFNNNSIIKPNLKWQIIIKSDVNPIYKRFSHKLRWYNITLQAKENQFIHYRVTRFKEIVRICEIYEI
ncbi:hypothetical protein H8356DRAFT_1329988 [Neocallimastix lanati (nom. inval.)]|nr:hypothetical protein H8356DRAFT_1329988 [Neocallimastix sp. JGI-2020a]